MEELPSKLRGLVRNVKKVEAEIAALKISYLKKINKGTKIVILDSWVSFLPSLLPSYINFNHFFTFSHWFFMHFLDDIYLIHRYSDLAKIVARTLTGLGFKNTWIVADGFSGGKGWLQSRLGTDSYNFSFAEVLSPSRVIPAAVRGFGTTSQSSRKLLPGADWSFFFVLKTLLQICASINSSKFIYLISFSWLLFHLSNAPFEWLLPLSLSYDHLGECWKLIRILILWSSTPWSGKY